MRTTTIALAAVLGLVIASQADATITLSIQSLSPAYPGDTGSSLQVQGTGSEGELTFNKRDSDERDFSISLVTYDLGGTGPKDAEGLLGTITGTFTYLNPNSTEDVQQASLTASPDATLTIFDGSGGTLTANIGNSFIKSDNADGSINSGLVLNLSEVEYNHGNTTIGDLVKFASPTFASKNITFQVGNLNLTDLANNTGAPFESSYSGSLTAVPEPGPIVLTALTALPMVGYYVRRRRKAA